MCIISKLAYEAYQQFESGNYESALQYLNQLGSNLNKNDSKYITFTHNKALCTFALEDFSNCGEYCDTLIRLKDNFVIQSGTATNDTITEETKEKQYNSRGLSGDLIFPCFQPSLSVIYGFENLDLDSYVILYNLAVIHLQQMQYGASRIILEHLYSKIEDVDEKIAVHICFLLLDVYIICFRGNLYKIWEKTITYERAFDILKFLENRRISNDLKLESEISEGMKNHSRADSKHLSETTLNSTRPEYLFRLHLYKAKIYLLTQKKKYCKSEIKLALEVFQKLIFGIDLSKNITSDGATSTLSNDGGRLVKIFDNIPSSRVRNMHIIYLQANMEYAESEYKKALETLTSYHGFQNSDDFSAASDLIGPHFYNNIGCIYHKLGRHYAASQYFRRSLSLVLRRIGKTSKDDENHHELGSHIVTETTCEVLYNAGIQYLLSDQPRAALICFEKSALLFYDRPQLWLRMAECCVAEYIQNSYEAEKEYLSLTVRGIVGRPPLRRVLLPVHHSRKNRRRPASQITTHTQNNNYPCSLLCFEDTNLTGKKRMLLSLEAASRCLHNVMHLLALRKSKHQSKSDFSVSSRTSTKPFENSNSTNDAANPDAVSQNETTSLNTQKVPLSIAALLKLSYIFLELDDPVRALLYAKKIINDDFFKVDGIPTGQQPSLELMLARIYAAEALLMQDMSDVAIDTLWPEEERSMKEPSISDTKSSESNCGLSTAATKAQMRLVLQVNLATVHLVRNDIASAEKCLGLAIKINPQNPHILRMFAYILLKKGEEQDALNVLKEGRLNISNRRISSA